jgi:hypothetical protein
MVLAALLTALVLATGAATVAADGAVNVTLDPQEPAPEEGERTTVDVALEGATDGVSAYQLSVEVTGGPGELVGIEPRAGGALNDSVVDDPTSATFSVVRGPNPIPGERGLLDLGNVTVERTDEEGGIDIAVTEIQSITDAENNAYTVLERRNETIGPVIDIGLVPQEQELAEGESTTVDVVLEGANTGAFGFDIAVNVTDGPGAITGLDVTGSPFLNRSLIENESDSRFVVIYRTPLSGESPLEVGTLNVERTTGEDDIELSVTGHGQIPNGNNTEYYVDDLGTTIIGFDGSDEDGSGPGFGVLVAVFAAGVLVTWRVRTTS